MKYEKFEIKCEVVRDLLPSYMEKLTSPESNRLVEEHLRDCADCRKYADEMGAEAAVPVLDAASGSDADDNARDIRPFRKLKKKMWRNVLIAVLICGVVCGGGALYFTRSWAPDYSDVKISCETVDGVATLTFAARDKNIVLTGYTGVFCPADAEAAGNSDECFELAAARRNPFTTPIRKNAYCGYTFIDENTVYDNNTGLPKEITDDSYFLAVFGDQSVKIKIKDLAEEKVTILE